MTRGKKGHSSRHPSADRAIRLPADVLSVDVDGEQHNAHERLPISRSFVPARDGPVFIPCENDTCTGGGFSLEPAILEVIREKKTEAEKYIRCVGKDPLHRKCSNVLDVVVKVVYS